MKNNGVMYDAKSKMMFINYTEFFIGNENIGSYDMTYGWSQSLTTEENTKYKGSNGILSGLSLPQGAEFDVCTQFILTRKQTKEVKAQPDVYRYIPTNSTFDFLDLHTNKFYPMSFRVVRIKITDTLYETLITNLDCSEFPPEELKELYRMRWGIEISFRELKYAVGLTNFHSKKREYIAQEVFVRITIRQIKSGCLIKRELLCLSTQVIKPL